MVSESRQGPPRESKPNVIKFAQNSYARIRKLDAGEYSERLSEKVTGGSQVGKIGCAKLHLFIRNYLDHNGLCLL